MAESVDRIPCKTPGCFSAILPDTAVRTGGLCMLCINAARARAKAEKVQIYRSGIKVLSGITDPVEMIKISNLHLPRMPEELALDEVYSSLTQEQADRLIEYVANLPEEEMEDNNDILSNLSRLTDFPLDEALSTFLGEGIFPEAISFRLAGPDIRDELIEILNDDSDERLSVHDILAALAWIGDDTVVAKFEAWRKTPPAWRARLYCGPELYAHGANWELRNGKRRDLFFPTATRLEAGESLEPYSFTAFQHRGESCRWCGVPSINLFAMDPLSFGIPAKTKLICVPSCEICALFGSIHGLERAGSWAWNPQTAKPKTLAKDPAAFTLSPENSLHPTNTVKACSSAVWIGNDHSQIGGMPTWIQDAEYPPCLKCRQTMMFLGQVAGADFGREGFTYTFICTDCSTTATSYQQS